MFTRFVYRQCTFVIRLIEKLLVLRRTISKKCLKWADHGSRQCKQWADHGSTQCSSWFTQKTRCKWKICRWVFKLVCGAWTWVAKWVCIVVVWVAAWVCVAWAWVVSWIVIAVLRIVTVVIKVPCAEAKKGNTMGTVLAVVSILVLVLGAAALAGRVVPPTKVAAPADEVAVVAPAPLPQPTTSVAPTTIDPTEPSPGETTADGPAAPSPSAPPPRLPVSPRPPVPPVVVPGPVEPEPTTTTSTPSTSTTSTTTTTVAVVRQAQEIDFAPLPSRRYGGTALTVPLSATSSSGLPVEYSTSTQQVCVPGGDGRSVVVIGYGTCTILADQPGDERYLHAPTVGQSFQVTD